MIFSKIKRTSVLKTGFIILAITYFSLIFVTHFVGLTVMSTIKTWFELFLAISLSLFVRDFANSADLGQQEGLYYRSQNIGYFIGPLIGGFLGSRFNYESVFIIASGIMLIALMYFYHQHIVKKHPAIANRELKSGSLTDNVKNFFSNPNRVKAYLVTFSLVIWLAFRRIYIPLYVITSGYLENMTGLILALGIIPFILLEEKVGEYLDKKGIKLPVSAGFLIIAVSLILIFINPYPLLNFVILIVANVGAALIEPTQEYFLFKNLPKEEEDNLYGIYITASPIAAFTAPLIGAVALEILPFNALFLIFGIIMMAIGWFFWKKL